MEDIKMVVIDSNEGVTSSIKKYFEFNSTKRVIATFSDGEEALKFLSERSKDVDLIIMDIILPKLDGLSLLKTIKKKRLDKKIIVLSSYMNEDIVKEANSLGTNYYMLKPFDLSSLNERIDRLYKKVKFKSNKNANLEIEVSEILHNLGIPSHIKGYQYIREGIMYIYNKNGYGAFITKEIYPEIALKYNTTVSRVERAIRHAIEISWERGDIDLMDDIFGHSIDYNRSKPTNAEYINTIADRIKLNDKVTV